MDYHGIEMKGSFLEQRVSSLPTWSASQIARTVYLTTNNKRYYANNVGWVEPEVDNIWTYQDTAPTGWSIITGTEDALLATKGGSRAYNTTGELQAGTWTQSDHTLTENEMPSHTHNVEGGYGCDGAVGASGNGVWNNIMDAYGIDMKGPFIGQRVSSLPTWDVSQIGRTVYLNTTNKRYYANNAGWVEPEVDNIWTYQDTAPTGWTIIPSTSDALITTKGGSRAYNTTGETQAGTWTQPDHTLTENEIPSHAHNVECGYGGDGATGMSGNGVWNYNRSTQSTGGDQAHNHGNEYRPGGDQAHNHGNEYRPLANIGITIARD